MNDELKKNILSGIHFSRKDLGGLLAVLLILIGGLLYWSRCKHLLFPSATIQITPKKKTSSPAGSVKQTPVCDSVPPESSERQLESTLFTLNHQNESDISADATLDQQPSEALSTELVPADPEPVQPTEQVENLTAQKDTSEEKEPKVSAIQSLVFAREMPICDALYLLAERYNKNIIPPPDMTGTVSFKKLYQVTFDDAMRAILGTRFVYRQEGSLIIVYTASELETLHRNKSRRTYAVITLFNISAGEARKFVGSILSPDGVVEMTQAGEVGIPESSEELSVSSGGGNMTAMNDTLMIYDYPENITRAREVIAQIDVQPKQVLIEATILSATLTEGMEMGIDWKTLNSDVVSSIDDITGDSGDYLGSSGTVASIGDTLSGGLTLGLTQGNIGAFIRAIEEVTDVTFLANPKILAVNKQLGQVYIGKKIAYQSQTTQTDSSTTQAVEFLDTGTKLCFRPYICDNGYIRMDIHPKDSSATLRTSDSTTLPDETSAELVTNIIVRDGQTVVIGGLFRDSVSTTKSQVPLLGDLPVVGELFKGRADEVQREEVIVLLTPHIIDHQNDSARWIRPQEDADFRMQRARRNLQKLNTVRRAEEAYRQAAQYYIDGDYDNSLKSLQAAKELYPGYIEALRLLEDKIQRQLDIKQLQSY